MPGAWMTFAGILALVAALVSRPYTLVGPTVARATA